MEKIPTAIMATLPPVTLFPMVQTEQTTAPRESGNTTGEPTSALPEIDATLRGAARISGSMVDGASLGATAGQLASYNFV